MNERKKDIILWILVALLIMLVVVIGVLVVTARKQKERDVLLQEQITQLAQQQTNLNTQNTGENSSNVTTSKAEESNKTEKIDYAFLKLENTKENKIYSPLSIKYALKMLEEGTGGNSKGQISKLLGSEKVTKYNSNKNMSLANALFVNSSLSNIKESYTNILNSKYNAEVKLDSFESTKNINSWVSEKTLNLINNAVEEISTDKQFVLINALGIDMDWQEKFLLRHSCPGDFAEYSHENFEWSIKDNVTLHKFSDLDKEVSGMEVKASLNNYDIVNKLGEQNIRQTVGEAYKTWAKGLTSNDWEYKTMFNGDMSDESIENNKNTYLDNYIKQINTNYKRVDSSTDFSLYVDNNIKVFAKDLKEYDGVTLQYVGIMPINQNLDEYIKNISESSMNKIISNLKSLKCENFKDGVVTMISGYIPKFDFEYKLSLMDDLKKLGVTDVFEQDKADLSNICETSGVYIDEAVHKANIEFTQDGIKAAAVTEFYGARRRRQL